MAHSTSFFIYEKPYILTRTQVVSLLGGIRFLVRRYES